MRKLLRSVLISALLALAIFAAIAFWPASSRPLEARIAPAASYEAARARAAALLAHPPAEVRPECRSFILDHGHRTRDAYVLLHGLTNCPAQFRRFGEELYASGANVIVPRLPKHGFTNRMTDQAANLTAQGMLDVGNEAVDLARGYGERVIVLGLSINGVTAAWLAQQRPDVDLAVSISPFFAPNGLPDAAIPPLTNLLRRLPNAFVWWDAEKKQALPGSPYSYPRFATRSIGETMTLGLDVFRRAQTTPPAAGKILLVTSPADTAISHERVADLAALWKNHATALSFPAAWKIPHDCIDPAQPGGDIARVYPQLRAWIDAALR
jgi:alpha-beta hydrolase superfamily lysophospholipase